MPPRAGPKKTGKNKKTGRSQTITPSTPPIIQIPVPPACPLDLITPPPPIANQIDVQTPKSTPKRKKARNSLKSKSKPKISPVHSQTPDQTPDLMLSSTPNDIIHSDEDPTSLTLSEIDDLVPPPLCSPGVPTPTKQKTKPRAKTLGKRRQPSRKGVQHGKAMSNPALNSPTQFTFFSCTIFSINSASSQLPANLPLSKQNNPSLPDFSVIQIELSEHDHFSLHIPTDLNSRQVLQSSIALEKNLLEVSQHKSNLRQTSQISTFADDEFFEIEHDDTTGYIPVLQPSYRGYDDETKPDCGYTRRQQHRWFCIAQAHQDFKTFRLTQNAGRPVKGDILLDSDGKILAISEVALYDFTFGTVADDDPDLLHLFTWHHIGADGSTFAFKILEIAQVAITTPSPATMKAIVNYLFIWLGTFPSDFQDPNISTHILATAHAISTHSYSQKDEEMRNHCHRLLIFAERLQSKSMTPFSFSYPLVEPTISPVYYDSLYKVPADVLCMHFAFAESNLIRHITSSDFVHLNWMRDDKMTVAPFMYALVNHMNAVSVFIRDSIITKKLDFGYWVDVMKEAYATNEFTLFFECSAALSLIVNNIRWPRKSETKAAFEDLNKLTNFQPPQIKAMKWKMFQKPSMVVPFLLWLVTDLSISDEASKKTAQLPNGADGINLLKHKGDLLTIDAICAEWATDIKFTNICPKLIDDIANIARDFSPHRNDPLKKPPHYDDLFGEKYITYVWSVHRQRPTS